jgi:flagellar biosynthesis/type III secretory pathway protein FliH
MPIIKSNQAGRLLKEAIVLDLGDVAKQAARIKAEAEKKAQQLIADAQQQAAAIIAKSQASGEKLGYSEGFEQGHKDGLAKGLAEGRKQGLASFEPIRKTWLDAATQWSEHRIEIDQAARDAVLDLTLQIVDRVIHRVLEVDPTVIADQLANALSLVLRAGDVTVRISPGDRPAVDECLPGLLKEMSHLKHVHVVEDAAISRGGCLVTYGQGQIDARLETLMQRVVDAILPAEHDASPTVTSPEPQLDAAGAADIDAHLANLDDMQDVDDTPQA